MTFFSRNTIQLMLITAIVALTLAGCGGSNTESDPDSESNTGSELVINVAPQISAQDNIEIVENNQITVSFSLTDSDSELDSLVVTADSSNLTLVSHDGMILAGDTAERRLTISPNDNATGSSVITLNVDDNAGGTASQSFTLTVISVSAATPEVTIDSGPAAKTTDPFAIFNFSATNASAFECQLDNGPYMDCQSPFQLPIRNELALYQPLSIGSHQLNVRAINSQQVYSSSQSWQWQVGSISAPDSVDFTSQRLIDDQVMPSDTVAGGWKGIFRVNCEFDHAAYDDPIVFPGMNDMAHLHMFYGTKNVDGHTDFNQLNRSESAGCSGGVLNRSAYWMPALLAPLYDPDSGERALDDNGDPAWQVVIAKVGEGERSADAAHELFYYSAGVDDLSSIQSPPMGLKIIAGNGATTPDNAPQSTAIARWHCLTWESSDAEGGPFSSTIPECYADANHPEMIRLDIFFPSCWNGVDLDSANHQYHMAYPITDGTPGGLHCPESHPQPIARVSFHYSFPIFPYMLDPKTNTAKDFRLASDKYTVSGSNGGLSLHGDWMNGWHPEAMDMIVAGCIKAGRDCHDGNFALQSDTGDWTGSLSLGPLIDAKGTEFIPEIINQGMGKGEH